MTENSLIRWAAPAAIAAAAIGVPADLYHFTIETRVTEVDTLLFRLHGVLLTLAMALLVVALAGIALSLRERLGATGRVGVAAAYLGTLLVLGNIATEAFALQAAPEELSDPTGYWLAVIIASFGLFAIGWFLVGLAVARSGRGAVGPGVLLCLGAVIGFLPLAGAYLLLLVGVAVVASALTRTEASTSVRAGSVGVPG